MGLTTAELAEVVAEGASAAEAAEAGAAAAAAAEAGGDAAAAGGAAASSSTLGAVVLGAAKSFAVSFLVGKLFSRDVNLGQGGTAQTFLANTLSNADPIPVIYGSRRVGASVIELGITATEVQADRLHRIAIWGEGPISAVQALLLDTKAALDPVLFAPGVVANIEHYTGTDGQAASAALIAYFADASRWNASCTLAGVAYTYFNLVWNPDYFPHGRPVVTADVDGRTLYDPRTAATAFSRNPALAIRDYLTNTRYGRSVPTSMIDDTAFSEAAWHCDDQVAIPDGNGGTTLQARYTCDGVLNVDQSALDNLRALLTSCRGFLVFSGGKYKLKIDRDETVPGASFGYDFTGGSARQFAGGADTPLSVTRAGTATRVNSAGLIEVMAANTLRLDYDPVTLACKGLLREPSRTNIVTQSQNLTHADWSFGGGNITATDSGIASPIAGVNFTKMMCASNTFTNGQRVIVGAGSASGNTATWYIKKGSGASDANSFLLRNNTTAVNLVGALVDYDAGTVTQSGAGTGSVSLTPAGSGAYRLTITATSGISNGDAIAIYTCYVGGVETAGEYALATGVQLEAGAFATSYIPTTTAAVTRNADVPTATVGPWFNAAEGTLLVEARTPSATSVNNSCLMTLSAGAVYAAGSGALLRANSFSSADFGGNGSAASSTITPNIANDTAFRVVGAYKVATTNQGVSAAGATATENSTLDFTGVGTTRLSLGSLAGTAAQEFYGHFRIIAYVPRRESNAELKAASSARYPFVLSADNIVGGWSIQLGGKRNRFNRVRARFFNKDASWQPDYAVWPDAGAAAQATTWLAQDAAQVLEQTLDLPFTRNMYTAAQIAQIEAKRSRYGTLVSLTATIAATCLEVGDVVPISHATPGWPAAGDPAEGKLFRVIEMELLSSDEVRLTLLEYQASVYQLATPSAVAVSSTSLPDMTLVAAPLNVAASSGTDQLLIAGDGTVISRLRVSWDATPSVFVARGGHVIVQFRKSSETDWQSVPPLEGTATQVWITPVDDAIAYDLRVAFENSISARSAWVQIAHTVVGKTQPPADVTGFQVSGTRLTWNPVTDADLWGYRLRLQPGSSQSWGDAIWLHGQGTAQQDVVTTPPFTLPIAIVGQATLMVKAVDLSGNESQNPATLVVNLTGPAIANVVQTFDRKAAGFPGTQTNCAVDGSGNLAANSTTLMWSSDDRASMWKADSTQLMWAAAAFAQLQYEDRIVTNGARAGSTLTLSATVQGDPWKIEYRENSTKAMWSADASSLMWNANSATLMWDTPTYLTWPGQVTVFPDSMFDFRITAGQAQTQGKITALTVTLDAPDITETLANVAISSGGTRLAPTKSYGTIKSVHLTTINDGGTAVSATQEDTQATGPLVKSRDGSSVAVNGHVNARIEGY